METTTPVLTTKWWQYLLETKPRHYQDSLTLNSDNITQCLESDRKFLEFWAYQGVISFRHTPNNSDEEGASLTSCTIYVSAPEDDVIHVRATVIGSCRGFVFQVRESLDRVFAPCDDSADDVQSTRDFYSNGNELSFTLSRLNANYAVYLHATFRNKSASERPTLMIHYDNSKKGYINTPGFDENLFYPPNMDSQVSINVPKRHMVMISFLHMDIKGLSYPCKTDHVTLHIASALNVSNTDNKLTFCKNVLPEPILEWTGKVTVRFVSGYKGRNTGFKLLFSFHEYFKAPEKLPGGRWNCSVPYWAQFREHFPCNLQLNCAGGEDELGCPYTSEKHCGLGLIFVGGRCYKYLSSDYGDFYSWDAAADACRDHGANVVSLNTPQEWSDVMEVLQIRKYDWTFIGPRSTDRTLPPMYRNRWQWPDGTIVYYTNIPHITMETRCTDHPDFEWFTFDRGVKTQAILFGTCDTLRKMSALCELPENDTPSVSVPRLPRVSPENVFGMSEKLVRCPGSHVTHSFLACDAKSECWEALGACLAPLRPRPPSFTCANRLERVPYTLVCDHLDDCSDSSDEEFCIFKPCAGFGNFHCSEYECVLSKNHCDFSIDCKKEEDEMGCGMASLARETESWPPPALIQIRTPGRLTIEPFHKDRWTNWNSTSQPEHVAQCPETHVQCSDNGYCIPVFLRCNGVYDCPGKEDEAACDSYTCPGFYRCRAFRNCLHVSHLCDGFVQCPQHDDEMLCNFTCPDACVCHGFAFFCARRFQSGHYPQLRYLDARRSGMTFQDLENNTMLIHLILAECGLSKLRPVILPNLQSLDLSGNLLATLSDTNLSLLSNLKEIRLARNPLHIPVNDGSWGLHVLSHSLISLDLSHVPIPEIGPSLLSNLRRLQRLNLSYSGLERVSESGFPFPPMLSVLDLRGCPVVEFGKNVFLNLDLLDKVYADNYKLCCPATLPESFNHAWCYAPTDEISSCEDLLGSDIFRVCLSIFALLSLLGNVGSFVYRVFIQKSASTVGYNVFVSHLCVADCLMGVYLAVIGVADLNYRGTYLWNDVAWKRSAMCKFAGFLSFFSSEVSAFVICLITLDRFLVLRFPLSHFHFEPGSAHVACSAAWTIGLFLAATPLTPMTSDWEFYSQNGICIPLPITRKMFPGRDYAFGVLILLNFFLFILIAIGQVFIYWSIRTNRMSTSDSTQRTKDMTIARRLTAVVVSDFLCWFPVGLLGLLSSSGFPVPGQVNIAMAIFVMPTNSALNPFLYTLNVVLERRRRAKEQRLQKILLAKLQAQGTAVVPDAKAAFCTEEEAWDQFKSWLSTGLLSRGKILKHVMNSTDAETTFLSEEAKSS